MKKIITISLLASFLFAGNLFVRCAGCHGAKAEKHALGVSKVIAELNATEIETALNGYKAGTFGGPMKGVMKGQVKDLNETQIKSLALYISKLGKQK